MTIDFPNDPRGREFILLVRRAQFERWLAGETQSLVDREFNAVLDLMLSSKWRDLTQYEKQRSLQLFRELERHYVTGYSRITDFNVRELKDYAGLETEIARAQAASMLDTGSDVYRATVGAFLPKHTLQSIAELPIQGLNIGQWFDAQARTMSLETRRIIQQGLIEGKGPLDIARKIMASDQAQGPVLVRRARNEARIVARTTVTAVQSHAAQRSYENLPKSVSNSYRYVAIRDSRTSAICFTGQTRATPLGRLLKVFRRAYQGDVLVITTAGGQEIEATPNHPILTSDGWLPAHEIEPGKHVVYSCLSHGFSVGRADQIGMPPTLAEIADALFDPAISEIEVNRATAEDFHGDGMAGDEEVHIAIPYRDLGQRFDAMDAKGIGNDALRWLHDARCFESEPGGDSVSFRGNPSGETPQANPIFAEHDIQPALGSLESIENFCGANAAGVHLQSSLGVGSGVGTSPVAGDVRHHSQILEQCRNAGRGSAVLPCQAGSGLPAPVSADDVVSVRRKTVTCHVFNLETSLGIYIAGRLIVKNCRALDGNVYRYDDPKKKLPPQHLNCVLGGTLVTACGEIASVSKRWVAGKVFVVRTASDNELTCTPNHPILTRRGWVAAQSLALGDDVVSYIGSKGPRSVDSEVQRVPATIEKIASAFLKSENVLSVIVPLSAPDFHGDGADSEVAVVATNRGLLPKFNATCSEHDGKSTFNGGDVRPGTLPRNGATDELVGFPFTAANRSMRGAGEFRTLGSRGPAHASELLLAAIARGDALLPENARNDARGNAQLKSDTANANSGVEQANGAVDFDCSLSSGLPQSRTASREELSVQGRCSDANFRGESVEEFSRHVAFDEIVNVKERDFAGHVFNLETEFGVYSANGILTHNCRSSAIPIILGADGKEVATSKSPHTFASYNDWLKAQNVGTQNDILGPSRADLWRSGKMTLSDAVDADNRVLTLAQLRNRLGIGIGAGR